jgi:hypothetical protein
MNVDGTASVIVLHKDESLLLSTCLKGATQIGLGGILFPGVMDNAYPEVDELAPNAQRLRPVDLNPETLKALHEGPDRSMVDCGKVSYSDVFSPPVRHSVTFCQVFIAHPKPFPVSSTGKFRKLGVLEDCRKLNALDQY